MRALLLLWAAPLTFFWSWYFISLNDLSFGTLFFSRHLHDLVFRIYGSLLGVTPSAVPGMAAQACLFDSIVVLLLVALRRRRAVARGMTRLFRIIAPQPVTILREDDQAPPAE